MLDVHDDRTLDAATRAGDYMSGKGDGRRPEATKGAFDRGYEQIDWGHTPKKVQQPSTLRSGRDRRVRTDQGREGDVRDASAGNLVR